MRRRRALTRSLPWYALAALITVTLYWNFDAHVEAHGEPGVDLMARQEIARITYTNKQLGFCAPGVSAPVITPVIDSQEYSYVKKSNGLLPDRGSSCIKSRSGLRTQTNPCDGATNGGHGSSHACISS